jgi:hypothetical protein
LRIHGRAWRKKWWGYWRIFVDRETFCWSYFRKVARRFSRKGRRSSSSLVFVVRVCECAAGSVKDHHHHISSSICEDVVFVVGYYWKQGGYTYSRRHYYPAASYARLKMIDSSLCVLNKQMKSTPGYKY